MKLKDFVYDPDRKVATLWLDDIEPVQLENLMMILVADGDKEEENHTDYESIIFGETI